ncbi:EPIDERMAL PATTERNING FACTOR-like protein 2 [Platanthera zijinensis]|uniref:Epidermal patterning factor-like protein n=1 Tax=Platanthera zijinensis TaxID=2320716 RepID=A0AAP0FW30_9ASPA
MLMGNSMIGSRPPQCEKRCLDCVHCEAVQVPATPQQRRAAVRQFKITNERDDVSNYKPMDWKCKCGNFIFNP